MLGTASSLRLAIDAAVYAPALFGYLSEIARPWPRDQNRSAGFLDRGVGLRRPLVYRQLQLRLQEAAHVDEHPSDARIVELAGDGGIYRHLLVRHLEGGAIALPLLTHVAQRILGAAAVELVQDHQFRVVQHVDLLELTGGAVVAGHDVDWEIDEIDDLGIGLTDAGGLHDDQVIALAAQEPHAVVQHLVDGGVLAASSHGTHEHPLGTQRVHADAITQQRA